MVPKFAIFDHITIKIKSYSVEFSGDVFMFYVYMF